MNKPVFPPTIYVTSEEMEGEHEGETILVTHNDPLEAADKGTKPCAIYRLVEVGQVVGSAEFVSKNKVGKIVQ